MKYTNGMLMSSVAAIIQHGKYFYKISIKACWSVWRVLDILIRLRIKLREPPRR